MKAAGLVIERPNGKLYRPRKGIEAVPFEDPYGYTGVAILRTHDPEAARARFADLLSQHELWFAEARLGWWRLVPWDANWTGCGRSWITDEVRGLPCVVFDPA